MRSGTFVDGHCGETTDGQSGDCAIGDFGMLKLNAAHVRTWQMATAECTQRCQACSRCKYISISREYKDCSWYASCDLRSTKRFSDFRSMTVQPADAQQQLPREWKPFVNRSSLVATREALGKLHPNKGKWPWVQPTARASVALVLYGKIGTLHHPSWFTSDAKAEAGVVYLAHATVQRHVLDANPAATMAWFIHSWNPSLGPTIDTLYRPQWSQHEPLETNDAVESASMSIARALRAVRRAERDRGAPFDLIACWRHDLHFSAPLRWAALPRAQLWFTAQCCDFDPAGSIDRYVPFEAVL